MSLSLCEFSELNQDSDNPGMVRDTSYQGSVEVVPTFIMFEHYLRKVLGTVASIGMTGTIA